MSEENKFNIGDRVIILDGRKIKASESDPTWVDDMDELVGCEGEVISIAYELNDVYDVEAESPSSGDLCQFFYSGAWLAHPEPFKYEEINVNDLFG